MESNPRSEGGQQPYVPVQVVNPRRPVPPKRRIGILGPLFFIALVLLGVSALLNFVLLIGTASFSSSSGLQEKFFSHERYGSDKIAIITVEGMIYDEDGGFVKRQIDAAAKDDDVKAIVLRVNSPGGTITGSDYLFHHLTKLRTEHKKPIVVSMGSLAASGGYYVSMAVGQTPDTIFAEETTFTGSIGVIISLFNASELLTKWGIKEDTVASHHLKNMGSFAKPMTEEEREIWQALVDEGFDRFKSVVKLGRQKFEGDGEALDKLATGQVYTGTQALELGLIDKIGFIEDAIDRAIALAGLDKDDVCVMKYKPEPTMADVLLGVRAESPSLDLEKLIDMTVPRGYYLCTRMTPLAGSGK